MTKDRFSLVVLASCICAWFLLVAIGNDQLSIPICEQCLIPLPSEVAASAPAPSSSDEAYLSFKFSNDDSRHAMSLISLNPWFDIDKAYLKPSCNEIDEPWQKLPITGNNSRIIIPAPTECSVVVVSGNGRYTKPRIAAISSVNLDAWETWSKRISQATLGFILAVFAFNLAFLIFDFRQISQLYLLCVCAASAYAISIHWTDTGRHIGLMSDAASSVQSFLLFILITFSTSYLIVLLSKGSNFDIYRIFSKKKSLTYLVTGCLALLVLPIPISVTLYCYWGALASIVIAIVMTQTFIEKREKLLLLVSASLILSVSCQVLLTWAIPSVFKPELMSHSIKIILIAFIVLKFFHFYFRINHESLTLIMEEHAALQGMKRLVGNILEREKQQKELIRRRQINNQRLEEEINLKRRSIEDSIEKLESERHALTLQSRIDPLTHLYNRRYFFDVASDYLKSSETTGTMLHIAFLDLDHFKALNDTYGHLIGDEALSRVAMTISMETQPLGSYVAVGRLGGEEFAIVATKINEQDFKTFLESVRKKISEGSIKIQGKIINVTASIGFVSARPYDSEPFDELLKRADNALIKAKKSGRNCIVEWSKYA